MLAAIHKHNTKATTPPELRVPVPQVFVLCEDVDVIGTPFYIMEFLDGRIFTNMSMPGVSPEVRREWCVVLPRSSRAPSDLTKTLLRKTSPYIQHSWLSAVRALGALSSLDPKDVGLANFGSHKPYFPRQIKSLSKVSRTQAAVRDVDTGEPVGDIPGWSELVAWYERHLPDERKTGGARIVHGDYKLDNLVFHPTENRVIGILDWELCTLGSPVRKANQPFVLCVVGGCKKTTAALSPAFRSLVACWVWVWVWVWAWAWAWVVELTTTFCALCSWPTWQT
jgi:aminoglycoside phosphotransferase (APT) family kinase protein